MMMQHCLSCDRPMHLLGGDLSVFCVECAEKHEVERKRSKLDEAELALEYWRRLARETQAKLEAAERRECDLRHALRESLTSTGNKSA